MTENSDVTKMMRSHGHHHRTTTRCCVSIAVFLSLLLLPFILTYIIMSEPLDMEGVEIISEENEEENSIPIG